MASAWGNSWGNAWGNSWGSVSEPTPPPVVTPSRGGGGFKRYYPEKITYKLPPLERIKDLEQALDNEQEILDVIMASIRVIEEL